MRVFLAFQFELTGALVMRRTMLSLVALLVVSLSMYSVQSLGVSINLGLRNGFYDLSCPDVERVVYLTMQMISRRDPDIPADVLRLHFHDCFVRGCDGSVLLDGPGTEKKAPPNDRLEGFQAIDTVKAAVEKVCPGVVSCADILAFAARDSVKINQGPDWRVPAGRRDGRVSIAAEAVSNLPGPEMTISQLVENFGRQGLSKSDMVVLSGAHTIGDAACHHIDDRLYNYPSKSGVDPIIPADFVTELKRKCPKPGLRLQTVDFDRVTSHRFDPQYYHNLVSNKGVLASDQLLWTDKSTRPLVAQNSVKTLFFANFAQAMIKMSKISPLTGDQGEIRLKCRVVNNI